MTGNVPARLTLCLLAIMTACTTPQPTTGPDAASDVAVSTETRDASTADVPTDAAFDANKEVPPVPDRISVVVTVTLDGVAESNVLVVQGGTDRTWRTGADGTVVADVDLTIDAEVALIASHPEARTWAEIIYTFALPESVTIALKRYDPNDNPEYLFQDPGEPGNSPTTAQCGHCHVTINEAWFASEHRTAASNPKLHDLYSGRAKAFNNPNACADAGGTWTAGRTPGTQDSAEACYAGPGALADMNGGCDPGDACEETATQFGGCADCHAPGINGALGGRNLLEATGIAFDYGVHCDICHKVESVDLESLQAGVAGRLRLHRPSENGSISLGAWKPLQFGPHPDVPNIRMGNVPRDHFEKADLCAGCHELEQPVLVAGATIDTQRWPTGRLPIHSTYSEWERGPMNPAAPCQSCHMPPDPTVKNSADLQLFEGATVGISGGWVRPPGSVRRHSWLGPRADDGRMLENAAALFVDVATDAENTTVSVTTKNVGPGHAIPTGEPLRSLVLTVEAACGNVPIAPNGGDAVSDVGGAVVVKEAGSDWASWPLAQTGDTIRVVALPGGYHDYDGYGPFGDGSFSPEAKGWRQEVVVGSATVVTVNPTGEVTLDNPLPSGDVAYLIRGDTDFAGRAGVAFARVLTGVDGQRMVPHHAAVDVVMDNRLLPQQAWTSLHTFPADCNTPTITARLWHLDVPAGLARMKGWERTARLMTEVTR